MRLWSIHPKYLDSMGLVALWREALLAKKVLEGKTRGYKNHPQLERFKKSKDPIAFINKYLEYIYVEAVLRGYNFDVKKIKRNNFPFKINVNSKQVEYEIEHIYKKLQNRAPQELKRIEKNIKVNPVFKIVEGEIEDWEKISNKKTKNDSSRIFKIKNLNSIFKSFDNFNIPSTAKRIIDIFSANDSKIYISGGFVRDIFLNKKSEDIDFVVNLSPLGIENLLRKKLIGEYKKIELQGKIFGVIRIIFNNGDSYEIATFRKDGNYIDGIHPDKIKIILKPEEDAKRRDLTINALFYDPIKKEIIDYVGGISDLKNKILRFVGEPELRISKDKSRMLRYIRFLLKTNFKIDKSAKIAIKKYSSEIIVVPNELIKKELDKMIIMDNGKRIIELLNDFNLLENILPEVKILETCKQGAPYHLEGSALEHTKLVCENLPRDCDDFLKWTAIFHDIGKPESKKIIIDSGKTRVSFSGHAQISAEKTKKILERLKFSKKEKKQIIFLVKNHMQMSEVLRFVNNNQEEELQQFIKKFIIKFGLNTAWNFINFGIADYFGSVSNNTENKIKNKEKILNCFLLAKQEHEKDIESGINIKKAINGKFIMKYLKINSGEELGKVKNSLITTLYDRHFQSKRDLIKQVKELLDNYKS